MLKTWHPFSINQWNKKILAWVLVAQAYFLPQALSQDNQSKIKKGVYDSYVTLLEIGKDSFQKKVKQLQGNPSNLLDLKSIDAIDLDPDYLSHVLAYSQSRYTYLGVKDECSLYDLLLAGVLRDHQGKLDYVIVRYQSKDDKNRLAWVKLDTFINTVASLKCPKIKIFQSYFDLNNFSKTIQAIKLVPPSNVHECKEIHAQFLADHKTPYLCSIHDEIESLPAYQHQFRNTPESKTSLRKELQKRIDRSSAYQEKINKKALKYLDNLCSNLEDPQLFCDSFFNKNFWSRVLDGERPLQNMTSMCQSILKRRELAPINYQACAKRLNQEPELCRWEGTHFPSLIPKPTCKELEFTLNHSRLNTDYQDCPGNVGNLAIVNVARILRHFKPETEKEYSSCSLVSASTFLDFNKEAVDARTWQVNLCYEDKINEKEVCYPTLLGKVEGSSFSLDKVVSQIMSESRGTNPEMACRVVSKKVYNPNLLEFKSGCFVIFDQETCSAVNCKIRIVHNEQEVTHITSKQDVLIDYFPNNTKFEKFSQSSLLKENLRIKEYKIINITLLKRFLQQHPQGIIHAMGCLEDIYPEISVNSAFAHCTPTPFIVDGFIEKNGYYSLLVRTAMDDIHSPRIVPWRNVYESVRNYQNHHPLKYWSLNGLYFTK